MYLIYVSDICIQHMMTVAGVKFLTPASPRCLLQGFAWKASQLSQMGNLTCLVFKLPMRDGNS